MTTTNKSRRTVLKGVFSGLCTTALLPGCGTDSTNSRDVIERILKLLRHQGVAAHLGRIEVEAKPGLQSMTPAQLAADILGAIGLDINAVNNTQIDSINERLSIKIRQDFDDETITTVDGWLLSATEAKICALVYLTVTQTSA